MVPQWHNFDITTGINGMYQANRNLDGTDFPIPDYHLADGGAYLYGKYKYHSFTASGGIRYDVRHLSIPDNHQFKFLENTYTGASSSLGLTWQASSSLTVRASTASGYRSPNITEIASNGLDPGAHIIYLGNRDFVPELSWQQDLGIDDKTRDWDLSLSLFNNHIRHYIYLAQPADPAGNPVVDAQGNKTFQYQQSAAHLYGVEAYTSVHPESLKHLSFTSTLAIVYGVNDAEKFTHTGIRGEYLPFIPPLRWTGNFEWMLSPHATINTGWEYNAPQHRYPALYNTETPTLSYTLIHAGMNTNIRLSKTLTIRWLVQIENLLNAAYQSNLSRLKYFEYYTQSPNGHLGIYNMGRSLNTRITVPF
ncbi:TonB-dependent receptor domain-containing protein [Puia sp. P3]|uniref:TonB-dependent receptor domain-containing protein n=1 Tax=Puia sp. P3 TaxID=3423952 RepID=UPI003D664FB3